METSKNPIFPEKGLYARTTLSSSLFHNYWGNSHQFHRRKNSPFGLHFTFASIKFFGRAQGTNTRKLIIRFIDTVTPGPSGLSQLVTKLPYKNLSVRRSYKSHCYSRLFVSKTPTKNRKLKTYLNILK